MSHLIYVGDRAWDKLVWGLVLIALGVFFLLSSFGYLPHLFLYNNWPVLVIAVGVGSLFSARDPRRFGSAVTVMGMGVWMLIAVNDWFGLGWYRSWPLALVAAGLGSLAQALAQSVWPRKEDARVL